MSRSMVVLLRMLAVSSMAIGPVPSSPPDATSGRRGLINATTQTFGGRKTFLDGGIVTESLVVLDGGTLSGTVTLNGYEPQTATAAALTLYMDPTGSDSNACTASGTSACLTLQGIWAKLPSKIKHGVTVNVAAGSYTTASRWDGVTWGTTATSGTTGVTVVFEGPALTNVTPASGVAVGTITNITTTSIPLPVVTDSGASWTTNDFRGNFLVVTSGAQAGAARVITSNTATTITTDTWPVAPSVGATFAIQRPAATFTGEQSFTGHFGGGGVLRFARIEFTSSSASAATLQATNHEDGAVALQLPLCRVLKTAGAVGVVQSNRAGSWGGASITGVASASYYAGVTGSGSGVGVQFSDMNVPPIGRFYAYSPSIAVAFTRASNSPLNQASIVAETSGASSTAIRATGVGATTAGTATSAIHAICPSGSTGVGVNWTGSFGTTVQIAATNCGTGFVLGLPAAAIEATQPTQLAVTSALNCTNTTTCVSLTRGARATITGTPTFSGVTTEYSVDGVTYTDAAVSALSPKRVVGTGLSIIERE